MRPQRRILSPFVLAEADYLITRMAGQAITFTLLEDVAVGAYELAQFSHTDIAAACDLMKRYSALGIGLADASVIVLSERHACVDILTLDQRHFRAVTGRSGRPFRLLPLDSITPS